MEQRRLVGLEADLENALGRHDASTCTHCHDFALQKDAFEYSDLHQDDHVVAFAAEIPGQVNPHDIKEAAYNKEKR